MKGLIIKDILTLLKQVKVFIIMILILSFIPGGSASAFAICYSALLPVTALAYDERSKWDKFSAMLPYSTQDIVLSKYLLGYFFVFAATLLSLIGQVGFNLIRRTAITGEMFYELLFVVCIGLLIQSINLPLMFKIGVEKGRILFIIITVVFIIGGTALSDMLVKNVSSIQVDLSFILIPVILITILLSAVSALLSIKLYKSHEL